MATFHLDLVSPERLLFSGDVDQVDIPGAEGDFGVLAEHAPFVSAIRPGILTIFEQGRPLRVVVSGGFAEVGSGRLTVLADLAVPQEDFDAAQLAREIKDVEEDAADAKDEALRDKLRTRLDQLKTLQAALS